MDIERIIFQHKWWWILLPLVVAAALLIPLRQARINPDLNTYLPDKIQAKVNLARLEAIFGKYEPVIIFLEADDILADTTLIRIKNLSRELNRMSEFGQVISLFDTKNIRGEDGAMIVDPVVKRIPKTAVQRAQLRESIRANDLAYKLVVSEDFRYAMILANPSPEVSDDEAIARIEDLLAQFPGPEKIYLNGTPYLKHEIQTRTSRDLAVLLPLGLLVMILFLFFSFREKRGVVLPLAVVVLSTVLSMGLLPLFGWELSIIAILVPIMMLAVANNYGVHIISRYQELNAFHPDWSMREIVTEAIHHLKKPILFTALTTIVGILGLVAHVMLPARQMGIVSAIGIAFALLLSLTFIPALLVGMKKGKVQPSFSHPRHTPIDRLLEWFGRLATTRPRLVVFAFSLALLLFGAGIFRLQVSMNHEKMMPAQHPLRVSTQIANDHFGGTKNITLLFEGDLKDPALLKRMDQYGRELEQLPGVGKVVSLSTVLRKMSQALNDPGEEGYDRIPETREAVAQYLELYSMSGDPADFEQLVDFDYTKGAFNIQFSAPDIRSFNRIVDRIKTLTAHDPQLTLIGGRSLLEKDLAEAIVRGQIYSLLFATLAIGILLFLIFRAFSAGLLGSLPLVFALICNFGLMGWLGLELDIASSLLSSIAIGIGVDYTIHLFWRLQAELKGSLDYAGAVKATLRTTGRGIAINALSVMLGFSVLFFSGLMLLKTFALLILFSLLLCLLSALVLIPALCILLRPRFLSRADEGIQFEPLQVVEKIYPS
ncbi:MAG: MMPL family transporter [Saprospirales bacterium]|nr:MMPL family transporter [Saprospirales bacterium]